MWSNRLRVLMAERKIDSISDLIDISGVSRTAINKLWHENKVESIQLETLEKICRALNVKLSDLIEFDPQKNPE